MKLVRTRNDRGEMLEVLGRNAAVKLMLKRFEEEKSAAPAGKQNAANQKGYTRWLQFTALRKY